MKKLFAIAILSTFFVASCAQEKEEREDFKEEHNVEKRNAGVPEAALSDSADVDDEAEVEND